MMKMTLLALTLTFTSQVFASNYIPALSPLYTYSNSGAKECAPSAAFVEKHRYSHIRKYVRYGDVVSIEDAQQHIKSNFDYPYFIIFGENGDNGETGNPSQMQVYGLDIQYIGNVDSQPEYYYVTPATEFRIRGSDNCSKKFIEVSLNGNDGEFNVKQEEVMGLIRDLKHRSQHMCDLVNKSREKNQAKVEIFSVTKKNPLLSKERWSGNDTNLKMFARCYIND
jgi:hypothetical protein